MNKKEYMEQQAQNNLDSLLAQEPAQETPSMSMVSSKNSATDMQEGYTPIDLNKVTLPKNLQGGTSDVAPQDVQTFNTDWNNKTPDWLSIYAEIKNKSYVLKKEVDTTLLGDQLLRVDRLESFPDLPNGARYNTSLGSWETFTNSKAEKSISAKITKTLRAWGTKLCTQANIVNTTKYVSDIMFNENMKGNPFNHTKPYLVSFKNGTFNIKTGEFKTEHNPEDYILNGHDYNLELNPDTPETDKYLDALIGESKQFMYEYLGYGFYRSYEPFQKILFIHGEGGEGKSYMINNVLLPLFGDENVSAIAPEDLSGDGSRFAPAGLYQKEMNIVTDIQHSYIKNPAILKKLTGGSDWFRAEFKGISAFNFQNYAKMIYSANELPTFSENSRALKDRFVLIDMVNKIDTRDHLDYWNKFDMEEIKAERGRLAYKCMLAFKKAYFDNPKHKLTESVAMKQDTEEWFGENDHFTQWLRECNVQITEVTNSNQDKLAGESTKYVLAEIRAFYDQNGYTGVPSTQYITKELKKLGVIKKRSRNGVNGQRDNVQRYLGLEIGISSFTDKDRVQIEQVNSILKNI